MSLFLKTQKSEWFIRLFHRIQFLPSNMRSTVSSAYALVTIIPLLLVVLLLNEYIHQTYVSFPILSFIVVATLGSSLLGFLLLTRVVRSIVRFASQVQRISESKEIHEIQPLEVSSEMGTIVTSFNSVIGQLRQKVQELEKLNQELEILSITDELTGLYNYRSFKEFLEKEISRSRRKGYHLALLMLDLDDFKIFNDQFGHSAGNEYLKQVAALLQGNVRRYDIVARYGGDEFAIILPETNAEMGDVVARRLQSRLTSTAIRTTKGTHHFISVSMGIASRQYGPEVKTPGLPHILEAADQALYAAKKQGKGKLETYKVAS